MSFSIKFSQKLTYLYSHIAKKDTELMAENVFSDTCSGIPLDHYLTPPEVLEEAMLYSGEYFCVENYESGITFLFSAASETEVGIYNRILHYWCDWTGRKVKKKKK